MGPEHYREAERLLAKARHCTAEEEPYLIRAANAHATLALAAATALNHTDVGLRDANDWYEAVGRQPAAASVEGGEPR